MNIIRNKENKEEKEFKPVIEKHIWTLSTSKNAKNTSEFNIVSWNGRPSRYEVRDWYIDKDGVKKHGKGYVFTDEQANELARAFEALKAAPETDN